MIEYLISLMISLKSLDTWKEDVYKQKYDSAVTEYIKNREVESTKSAKLVGNISWYAKGLKNPEALTTACWNTFPKGTNFRVTYNGNSVVVVCNDRGHFREMGRVLDLSSGAFRTLAPLNEGIIRGAEIEVIQ